MTNRYQAVRLITTLSLIMTIGLGLFVYAYPILKPVPSGVDSSSYIYGARWITEHHTIPKPGQPTYQGLREYTAPLTDINLAIVQQLSKLDITYPIFSGY